MMSAALCYPMDPAGARHCPTDVELYHEVRNGDQSAAAHLYDRFAPDINRVVWKTLGGDADHHDLVHDIFLKVWHLIGRNKVREPERLNSWVVAVAINTVRKELRRRYIRSRLLKEHFGAPDSEGHTPDYQSRDLLRALYRMLDRFPPEERLVYTLRHFDERPLADIAEICGCSTSTIKRRLLRAEHRLSQMAARYPAVLELVKAGGGV